MNVLVVDDGEDMRRLMTRIIQRAGHEVVTAADGQCALDALTGRRFDVVVTDMRMPGLSGADVIQAIRSMGGALRLVAMSGGACDHDLSLDHAQALGADAVLAKPFSKLELLASIGAPSAMAAA